jgi:PAS domain-containing protein
MAKSAEKIQKFTYNYFFKTIEGRLLGLLLGFGAILLLLSLLIFWQNQKNFKINQENVKLAAPITNSSRDILIGLGFSHRQLQRCIMVFGDDSSHIEAMKEAWQTQILPSFDKLKKLRNEFSQKRGTELIDSIAIFLEKYRLSQQKIIQAYEKTAKATAQKDTNAANLYKLYQVGLDAVSEVANAETLPIDTKLRALLAELINTQEKTLNENFSDLHTDIQQTNYIIIIFLLGGLLLTGTMGYILLKFIKKSLLKPTQQLSKLALGELADEIPLQKNELDTLIQSTNQLTTGLQKASDFALHIGQGNFNSDFKPLSENDYLGNALLQMREQLQNATIEAQKRNWSTQGYALFGDLIRANNENIKQLLDKFLSALIEYVEANQGGIFLINDEKGQKYLDLSASYAYNRKKYLQKRFRVLDDYAESLVGQVFLEKEKIYLTEIPTDYLSIISGLGATTPKFLLILPIKANDMVEGVLEIASFNEFAPHVIEFMEKLAESLASSIRYVRINQETRKLLEDSQIQRESLLAQEEEMRQNMEELQATQESMRRTQEDLIQKEANLSALINNTTDSIIMLDNEYKVIFLNKVLKDRYKNTNYEGIDIGVNALDFLGSVRGEWKVIYDRGLAGEAYDFTLKSTVNNEDSFRQYFIHPIKDQAKKVVGVSVFSRDITPQKLLEQKNENTIKELTEKIKAYEKQLQEIVAEKINK